MMEFLNSAWEVLITVRDVLFYNKMLEEAIRGLKRYAGVMRYKEKDVQFALESLKKRLEIKRKREVDDWLEKVKRKITEVDQREQEVRETRYFLRWRLLRRIQEDLQEMRELHKRGGMFYDFLTEDGSQGEIQRSGEEILEDVQPGSSESCRSPQYYRTSHDQSLWEKLRTSISKRLYHNKTLEEEIWDLKNDAEAMCNIEEDVKSALESLEKRHGKKRKREVDDWLEKVQKKRAEVDQREQEVRESRYLWQWRLRRRIQKDVEEVGKLCEQGFFSDGLLTEDGSQGEVQRCDQGILVDVQAGSSDSCSFHQYYWTSDDQSVEYQTLEEDQEDTEEVEVSKLGISKGKGITNPEPGTLSFQMASSSSTIDNSEHDVFLSFKGCYSFTGHLYEALRGANINIFMDDSLDRGEAIAPSLHRAIERAKISVVVFSSGYVSSSFCLDKLVKIIECKESKEQFVLPIFYKVDPSDVERLYEETFAKHKAEFKETSEEEMKVQRWKSALRKTRNLSGWHIADNCDEFEAISPITQHISEKLYGEPTRKSKGQELIVIPLVGESTVANLEKIWKCLMDDNISTVGIHGMGGVGKTTIVTHISNQLIRDANCFQHVYWVTVSKESSIYKLQSQIAEKLELDLSREEDERERAAKLWWALNNKKKFVLILDDMWESFELKEVGIPISADGGKLLLTTREHRVCKRMKCEGIVKVEPLVEREARDLFIRECGHRIDDDLELKKLVESVVKECDGLPRAIVAIARSTRGFVENNEWRNILKELQKPSDRQNHDMEEKVFKVLKVNYDRLRNDKYRLCLQYCAMCPEDYRIHRDDLIEYCIAEGIIDELDSRQEEFDMGNTIIDELIDASLLEQEYGCAKMRDVVRDMVLTITRGKLMVKAGLQLQDFPKFSDWSANLEGISIMENYNLKACSFNSAPNCYKLRILLMGGNVKLSELPNYFFVHMQNLTILDMSFLRSLKLLPDSISKLEALRMLNLDGCYSLEYIPSLAALKYLRYLNLSDTNIRFFPEGMEKLVNLKLLHIMNAEALCGLIPSEVLKELSLLQSLNLLGSNVEVDPDALSCLQKLETLGVDFKNIDALNSYLKSRHWQRLRSYHISIKNEEFEEFEESEETWRYDKTLWWCKDSPLDWDSAARKGENSDFVIPFNVQKLILINWDSPLDGAFINGGFAHLKDLTLKKCKLKYLISVAFAKQLLQNLQYLDVYECEYLEEIIGTEKPLNQSNHKNYPTIELPNLWSLTLRNLPRLRSIYRGNMDLPSLHFLEIDGCEELERLPFRAQPDEAFGSNIDSKLWWDSLQWDDQNHKQVFEKYILEAYNDFSNSEPETETETGLLDLT